MTDRMDPEAALDGAFWDERYRSADAVWSRQPNPQLVAEAQELPPRRALDVGCGEGADALWLAERGWRVTAVDVSAVALERGAARAAETGLADRVEWRQDDLREWAPESEAYDLVSSSFLHLPEPRRSAFHRDLAAAVAPGGTLLVVAHSPSDLQTNVRRPPLPELYFTAAGVAGALDREGWEVEVCEARPRTVPDRDGNDVTVHDEVLRARRRSGEG